MAVHKVTTVDFCGTREPERRSTARTRANSSVRAVSITTGIALLRRTCRSTSKPSSTGSIRSRITRS